MDEADLVLSQWLREAEARLAPEPVLDNMTSKEEDFKLARPTPQEERDWAKQCAERKVKEQQQEFEQITTELILALSDAGVHDSASVVYALERFIEAKIKGAHDLALSAS